jgi:HEAT repeat protein
MPRLSPRASALVHELWRERARPPAWRLAVLRELAATGEANAAPYILGEYLQHDLPASEVVSLFGQLARGLSMAALLGMERERLQSDSWYVPASSQPLEKLNTLSTTPGGWLGLAIASFSRNGHIRERAVRALGELQRDGREVPFLALRTADYVQEVRRAATSALASRFTAENAPSFVLALPLLRHLDAHRLRKEPSVLAWVLTYLSSPEGWPALRAGLEAPDRSVRRECFALAVTLASRREEVVRRALHDPDPLIRLRGVRELESLKPRPEDVLAATRDPFTPARIAALALLSRVDEQTVAVEWRRALLDSSAAIRAMARAWLAGHRPLDVAAFYREALAKRETATLVPAIAGIAEVGQANDAADLLFLTEHPQANVREAVAASLGRLLGAEAIGVLVTMLGDASPRVARKARRLLERHLSAPVARGVWELVENLPAERASAAIRLLSELPKWDALDYLLRALDRPEPTRTEAVALVQRWRDRSAKAQWPLGSQGATRFRERLAALPEGLLLRDVVRSIDFELAYWAREGH